MGYSNNYAFTTKDCDNDWSSWSNTAEKKHSARWYKDGAYADLNGKYNSGGSVYRTSFNGHDSVAKGKINLALSPIKTRRTLGSVVQ